MPLVKYEERHARVCVLLCISIVHLSKFLRFQQNDCFAAFMSCLGDTRACLASTRQIIAKTPPFRGRSFFVCILRWVGSDFFENQIQPCDLAEMRIKRHQRGVFGHRLRGNPNIVDRNHCTDSLQFGIDSPVCLCSCT